MRRRPHNILKWTHKLYSYKSKTLPVNRAYERGVQPVHRPGEEGCSAGTSARRAEASESLKGSIAVDVLFWFFHLFYWYFRLFLVYLILIFIPNLFFLRDAKVVIWIRYFYKREPIILDMCLSVRNSVLWCPIRFPHKNDVRFVFTSSCL